MNTTFQLEIKPILADISEHVKELNRKDAEHVELDAYLQESSSLQYSTDNEHAFFRSNTTRFPEELARQIEQPTADYQLGFLSEINHVWLIKGRSLFLWNYNKSDDSVFRYNCEDVIENVGLIIFNTHNELFVSTKNNIFMHAIQKAEPKIQLVSTATVHTRGISLSDMHTTDTKRSFARGSDGHLYELSYSFDQQGFVKGGKLTCHTSNPLLYYLPSIFKTAPSYAVKSLVLDNADKRLYILLSDSSIHVAKVEGNHYVPEQRYMGTKLESIHLVTDTKHVKLMAITNDGNRLYFAYESPNIVLKATRPAPPLPGSLLFNKLAEEHVDLTFYNYGVYAAILSKSQTKYLVFTNTSVVGSTEEKYRFMEDMYYENLEQKIWHIIEDDSLCKLTLKSTLESPDNPARQFALLTASGIVHYTKQRVIDYLKETLDSDTYAALLQFMQRYGAYETNYLILLLACLPDHNAKAIEFIRESSTRREGLLLYFSRLVQNIWFADIKQRNIPKSSFQDTQGHLKILLETIESNQIPTEPEVAELYARTIEAISFIVFMHELSWEHIVARLNEKWNIHTFAELVTTDRGAELAQNIVYTAIETSNLSNATNSFSFIGNFLHSNCSILLGEENVVYLKGVENIHAARQDESARKQALATALDNFKSVIYILDLDRTKELSQRFAELGDHKKSIDLVFAKYHSQGISSAQFQDLIIAVIKGLPYSDESSYAVQVVDYALSLTDADNFHAVVFDWLLKNVDKAVLTSLKTPSLLNYLQTQIPVKSERLACLELYCAYRGEFDQAVDYAYELATDTPDVDLDTRISYLKKACEYLPEIDDCHPEKRERVECKHEVSNIQKAILSIFMQRELSDDKQVVSDLADHLFTNDDLLKLACERSLYEEGLYLLDILDKYDWEFIKTAWEGIVSSCVNEEETQSKLSSIASRVYPSINSFPVFIIFDILQKKYDKSSAEALLVKAGVPADLLVDIDSTQ